MAACLLVWLLRLRRLWASVARHATFWANPRGTAGGLLYVALGDSAAQGIGATSPERGYVWLLAQHLQRSTGRPVRVLNLSSSGARLADVVSEQLPALRALPHPPDLVTVDVGGNDLRRYDPVGYATAVAALVAGLPAGVTVLADIPYFMHGRFERQADAAAHQLRELALARGLVVAELHEAMRAGGWAAMFTNYAADWFHPNNRGHRTWYEVFRSAIVSDAALARRVGLPVPAAPPGLLGGPGMHPPARGRPVAGR